MGEPRRCRACRSDQLGTVLDFGEIPVADLLLREDQLAEEEPRFHLKVAFCGRCSLLQLTEVVDPDTLYGDDYPYFSSTVPGLLAHFTESARELVASEGVGPGSLVVEAASNDGYMLRVFADAGAEVLGIDPASGPASAANHAGIPTVVDFFSADLARGLRSEGHRVDLLIGNNVLNLVPDPNDFAEGVGLLVADGGVAVLEVPYAVDAVEQCAYDNFFHQNCSYFSLTALVHLFARHQLEVLDVQRVTTFGGSLRVRVGTGTPASSVPELLGAERECGVHRQDYYRDFADRATKSRDALVELLAGERRRGRRIVAYGAAGGMATTLLGFAGLDADVIDYAVDVNPHKHGLYTPGSRLRIHPPSRLLEDRPDLVLLLAWNYRDEILEANRSYREGGGRFVIPIPEPEVV